MTLTNTNQQKIAWVTGVNQGIGAEIMRQLTAQNIQVIGFDVSVDQVPAEFKNQVYACDVRHAEQVSALCTQLLQTAAPDYFVNVAGVLHLGAHEDLSLEAWQQTFEVNVYGAFYFLRHLSPYFKQKRSGSIVMVSSNAAHAPRVNMAAYGASKAALTSFSKTVGLELAEYGVRVNIVSPGSTATPMQYQLWTDASSEQRTIQGNPAQYKVGIPLQKIAQPQEIANAVLFFLSEQATHITMHDLVVDGGATLGQ
ncbi:MAG: 2,3-dihydro-2,3-dihydroxybenzoate dehydrogenase [Acinetobacter sp.]